MFLGSFVCCFPGSAGFGLLQENSRWYFGTVNCRLSPRMGKTNPQSIKFVKLGGGARRMR
jgi:hypothetical protein